MAQQGKRNIQDDYLNTAKQKKSNVTVFTVNGVKLTGIIKDFDSYTVIVETNQKIQLVYKHAISTVVFPDDFSTNPK